MRTVFLVPRRRDHGHRDKLWSWCSARWERLFPDIPIVEGHHDRGPFNRSAAINTAAKLAGQWDFGIVIDSDVFLRRSLLQAALDIAAETGKVTWPHRRWRGLSEDATARAIGKRRIDFGPEFESHDMDLVVEKTTAMSWSCCIVIPRAVFDDIGGFDERFEGWGFEDMAFRSVVTGLYGWNRLEGDVFHLWHPRSEERIVPGKGRATATPEYRANGRLGRRYMVAAIRDYGIGDQVGQEHLTPIEQQRHVANLMNDDKLFSAAQSPRERARWDGIWPTLEELRDSWKERRPIAGSPVLTAASEETPEVSERPERPITLVVHSGGEAANWPERREYLRRSLSSLMEHITGPIVQAVVYSDWDANLRPQVAALAEEHGFYVAGDGHHGYTAGMARMWMYLRKRAVGEFVFLAEDDFVYEHDIDLAALIRVLDARPAVSQVALLRHPAYQSEVDKGGVLGWPPETFTPHALDDHRWLEHRNFWTANPSLFRRNLVDRPWPVGNSSERLFGNALFRDPKVTSAFWGNGTPQIRHIGDVRAGASY